MENPNESRNVNKEIIIENKYQITKELFKEWAKENKRVIYFRIFWIIFAIYCIGMTIFCIISNNIQDSIPFILFAFYAVFGRIVVRYFSIDRRYNMLEKFYKKTNWERRIIFFDDYFETIDGDINHLKLQYNDIINIAKTDGCIKIKMSNGYIRIYKNAFVKSNFEECEKFLNNKKNDSISEV